jgi:hypothetical protein
MTGSDASSGEMPGFPFSRRPASELDESLLDALLLGLPLPLHAPEPARTLADMLAILADPASPGALAGENAARSAFARAASPAGVSPAASRRSARRRRGWLPVPLTRLAAALIAVTVGLGGVTAAAYAGALPGPIQDLAHQAIGAPAAHRDAPHAHPSSPRARSALCAAYQHAKTHGEPSALGAEFGKLAKAAGGASRVEAYCAPVRGRGAAAAGHAKPHRGKQGESEARGDKKSQPKPHAAPRR